MPADIDHDGDINKHIDRKGHAQAPGEHDQTLCSGQTHSYRLPRPSQTARNEGGNAEGRSRADADDQSAAQSKTRGRPRKRQMRSSNLDATNESEEPSTRRARLDEGPKLPAPPTTAARQDWVGSTPAKSNGDGQPLDALDEDELEDELHRIELEERKLAVQQQLKKKRKDRASQAWS